MDIEQQIQKINKLIKQHHDPSLHKPNEAPNGNHITMVSKLGEICDTKGGFAFLQRTIRVIYPHSYIESMLKYVDNIHMSINVDYGYCMVANEQIGLEIRREMEALSKMS